ncbi:MAG: macro domain-containing protein [Myxococcota bacterium]
MKLVLVDRSANLVGAWGRAFADVRGVEVRRGDYLGGAADAIVSPANSFGYMDGGVDLALRSVLGKNLEVAVQTAIAKERHGELPVGDALVVATGDARLRHLVVAPTMRVPSRVDETLNAYLAFRAALLVTRELAGEDEDFTLRCCGLGTGVGAMPARRCAVQMRAAYRKVFEDPAIASPNETLALHRALLGA